MLGGEFTLLDLPIVTPKHKSKPIQNEVEETTQNEEERLEEEPTTPIQKEGTGRRDVERS